MYKRQEQEALLAENGIHILTANWAYGERNIMTTKPVRSIEDMQGLIIRTPTTPSYMKAFEYMGAAPTALALGDVYTATQQGTVEGMENPLATLYGQAYYEVAKYITLTKHVLMPTQWICNEDFFQSLTPEQQQWLCETGDEAGVYNNQLQDEMLAQYMDCLLYTSPCGSGRATAAVIPLISSLWAARRRDAGARRKI